MTVEFNRDAVGAGLPLPATYRLHYPKLGGLAWKLWDTPEGPTPESIVEGLYTQAQVLALLKQERSRDGLTKVGWLVKDAEGGVRLTRVWAVAQHAPSAEYVFSLQAAGKDALEVRSPTLKLKDIMRKHFYGGVSTDDSEAVAVAAGDEFLNWLKAQGWRRRRALDNEQLQNEIRMETTK